MLTERLISKNQPDILEDPVAFIGKVNDARVNNNPQETEDFKSWLLDQWTQIDSRISQTDFELVIRPYNQRPRGTARNVTLSDKIHLSEWSLNEEVFGGPRVELRYREFLLLSPENKGEHRARIEFKTESKAKRNLTNVFVEDRSVDVDSEGKPFTKRKGFAIKISPDLTIRELAEHETF